MAKANWSSDEPCVCCGLQDSDRVCYHHLLTQKTYPEYSNEPWNKISLCQIHHTEYHKRASSWMADNYPGVERWLVKNGWFRADPSLKQRKWLAPIWR